MINQNELMKKEDVMNLNLPKELIYYLVTSERLAGKLFVSILKDIEDLYLYYSNMYRF